MWINIPVWIPQDWFQIQSRFTVIDKNINQFSLSCRAAPQAHYYTQPFSSDRVHATKSIIILISETSKPKMLIRCFLNSVQSVTVKITPETVLGWRYQITAMFDVLMYLSVLEKCMMGNISDCVLRLQEVKLGEAAGFRCGRRKQTDAGAHGWSRTDGTKLLFLRNHTFLYLKT